MDGKGLLNLKPNTVTCSQLSSGEPLTLPTLQLQFS